MRREIQHSATLLQRTGGATLVALLAMALTTAAGCGESKTSEARPVAEAPPALPPVSVAPPLPEGVTTSPGLVVPENVSYGTAEAAFASKRYDEAMAMFEVYTRRKPENAWGHYMLGLSAWKAGEREVSTSAFEAALAIDSTHVKSLLNLGRVLLELGRPEDALVRVETALALDPELADAHRVMGRVRTELGQSDEAAGSFRKAITLDENDSWSMNNLALVLIRQGRYEEALGPLARATELRSDVATFHNNLGVALERTGHYVAAAESYRTVLAIDSSYAKAAVSLARVEGRTEEPELPRVDLGELSRLFVAEVERWREVRM